ncbi:helix-turn-helix transcriptional regulator [Pelagibacterium flavum]|uniref:Helix-turn-helix transcriptional regulator n=2 Tax=Pelagibacterium TaxID=1082930 RepID=A0ABZ2I631_9HYPH|nr:helix-turn-helix transcriptional regulator [Pelagibacterium sp. YIM 151497]MAN77190.1 transcriptional regulator [Hyphomicrobiales bacterium]UYQ73335.1 helix-turn-helix transcriptional regulator [Pelagibacterium sp. YIM 151497]|tara:strand:+ start:1144 stop:1446 length:303 start_codon:yes stop_codon:yes gene_type:complete
MLQEALRLIRVFHDLKQFEVAEKIGVSKSYISELENGSKAPSLEVLQRYSSEFGIPVSSLMFFSEQIDAAKSGEKVRTTIASKVIDILKFIENKSKADAA